VPIGFGETYGVFLQQIQSQLDFNLDCSAVTCSAVNAPLSPQLYIFQRPGAVLPWYLARPLFDMTACYLEIQIEPYLWTGTATACKTVHVVRLNTLTLGECRWKKKRKGNNAMKARKKDALWSPSNRVTSIALTRPGSIVHGEQQYCPASDTLCACRYVQRRPQQLAVILTLILTYPAHAQV